MATVYGNPDNFRVKKVLIAAKLANKPVKTVPEAPPAKKFPLGLAPALDDGKTQLFGADAIAKYLLGYSNSPYLPQNPELDQWIGWADSSLLPNVLAYVLPSISAAKIDPKNVEQSKKEFMAQLTLLNDILLDKTFLVGERMSLADISVAANLLPAYQHVLGEEARKQIGNVNRWFLTVLNNPEVKSVVGDFAFIQQPSQFNESEYNKIANASAGGSGGQKTKEAKKEQKPAAEKQQQQEKQPKKKAKEEDAEEMDAADEAMAAQPKFTDPLAALPKGSFSLDGFKRVYSNEDTATKAIPYFWEHFDPELYSIWFAEYKYPEELRMVYMSCNLIGGMFQRLEKLKKTTFASVCLFGTDNNSTISGVWVWPGQELAFPLCPDWQVDYESYDWRKLDPKEEATKRLVNEYLMWEGDFGGKAFKEGKIFK